MAKITKLPHLPGQDKGENKYSKDLCNSGCNGCPYYNHPCPKIHSHSIINSLQLNNVLHLSFYDKNYCETRASHADANDGLKELDFQRKFHVKNGA